MLIPGQHCHEMLSCKQAAVCFENFKAKAMFKQARDSAHSTTLQTMKNIRILYLIIYILAGKFSVYLNGHVVVMAHSTTLQNMYYGTHSAKMYKGSGWSHTNIHEVHD